MATNRRSYGEGTIHPIHVKGCPYKGTRDTSQCGCRWRATIEGGYNEHGKRRRPAVTGRSEAEVARKLARRRTEIQKAEGNATAPDAARKTVHSWAQDWLKLRDVEKRPKTYEGDQTAVRIYIDPVLGRKRLVDLSPRDVRALDAKCRQAAGESTVVKVRSKFLTMMRDAIAEGYAVPTNLFEASKSRGHGRSRPVRKALEIPQAVAVLAEAAKHRDYARWVAGFYQGIRQGEALGLVWDETVDMDRGVIELSWQLQPLRYRNFRDQTSGFLIPRNYETRQVRGRFHLVRPKTDRGWRVMPMTEDFHAALAAWREVWPENDAGLIFTRDDGWPISRTEDGDRFHDLQRAAGVRKTVVDGEDVLYTTHEMRNTCATILTVSGVDPATVTAILGHSSWSTSLGYVTSQLEHMRAALQSVNAAYAPRELGQ